MSIVLLVCVIIGLSTIIYLFLNKKIYIIFLIITFIGFIYVNTLNVNYQNKYKDINGEIKLRGVIITDPEDKEYKFTYIIKVVSINGDNKYKNTKLILNFKKTDNNINIPKFGNEIEIIGEIEKPQSARNYKGFDYKAYLKSKKIYGTIENDNFKLIVKNRVNFIENILNKVQKSIKINLFKILKYDEAALCIGILVGIRDDISQEIENDFKMSNLTHMLAVSGSHITYIISAISFLLAKTCKSFTKIFIIIFLVFFMALTGFTASVIRASIMGILILLASLLHRKSDTINNLGVSSLIILICNPYLILDLGFLLSYSGTIGIILLGTPITRKLYDLINNVSKRKINLQVDEKDEITENCASVSREILKIGENRVKNIFLITIKYVINAFSITVSANLMIIPIMAYSFSTISFTFWISNILAGPIMEIVTIFGFMIYFISLVCYPIAHFLGIFLNFFLDILIKIANISSLIPGASIYIKTPYLIQCILFYMIIYGIYNKSKLKKKKKNSKYYIWMSIKKYKIIVLFSILFILIYFVSNLNLSSLKIYFIDVGQGDCTLIKTPGNKNILIDGGGSEFGNFDVGENILLPYLLDRRVTTIDYIIISHFDSDHIGGLFSIMENLKVKNIIISVQGKESENLNKFKEIIAKRKINVTVVQKGDYLKFDKYSYMEILFPEEKLISENILNNNSIVAKFHSLGFTILFTGDIEEIAEKRLIELYEETNKLESTIIKVAHHGSKSSSINEFLKLVKPKIAFIGVGENNNFGHPNEGVLDRLESMRYKSI